MSETEIKLKCFEMAISSAPFDEWGGKTFEEITKTAEEIYKWVTKNNSVTS